MNQTNFPISAQILIPSANRVSVRLMFIRAESLSGSITLNNTQTLTVNSVSVVIEKLEDSDLPNWTKFKITASTGDTGMLALDMNFMGNDFRVENPEGVHWHGDEMCFDLDSGQEREVYFWISQNGGMGF